MWINSNTNCSKQRKEPWNLVNFLHAQVSHIFIDLNANYCSMKKRNLEKYCNIPSIKPGYGWIMDSAQFSTDWLQRPPGLELMLVFMACKCSKTCKLPSCQCLVNSFKCHLQRYETWTRMTKMLIYLEWRLDDHNEDTYPKWDVDILRLNCVNQLCLLSHNMCLSSWDSQPITFHMDCCTYV